MQLAVISDSAIMAALVRSSLLIPKLRGVVLPFSTRLRNITTSKKNSEVGVPSISELAKTEKDFSKPETDTWISYGFDLDDKEFDRSVKNLTFFGTVSICLVVGCFYFAYMPDFNLSHWGTREAYLEIRRREQLGLPHIDPNYVDPNTVVLPSEEELGDTEIII